MQEVYPPPNREFCDPLHHYWPVSSCVDSLVCLVQEPEVVLGCVQLLQSLSQYRQHLKDLPTKTMMDILNEVRLRPALALVLKWVSLVQCIMYVVGQ